MLALLKRYTATRERSMGLDLESRILDCFDLKIIIVIIPHSQALLPASVPIEQSLARTEPFLPWAIMKPLGLSAGDRALKIVQWELNSLADSTRDGFDCQTA
jgi:hypothetical protein